MVKLFVIIFLIVNISFGFDINEVSQKFLDKPYKANSLIGNIDQKEKLVIDTTAFDCFTFIDTLEALKSKEFESALIAIRYKNNKVEYKSRNHFFSDWVVYNKNINDISCEIGKCKKAVKYLNKKDKKRVYLKGIDIVKRDIYYIKPLDLNITKLKTGDYMGIYTKSNGLDVTHVGIVVKKKDIWYLRHASSKKKKVIDSKLLEYIKNKDGIIIYRSRI